MTERNILTLRNVDSYYGKFCALSGIDLSIPEGALVCLLGSNAAGKTTTLKTILGSIRPSRGEIEFLGQRIEGMPTEKIVGMGISIVPENRRIFPKMTVLENLELGAYLRNDKKGIAKDMQMVFDLFPRLAERVKQYAATLSGGEQQMLATGRALMSSPKLILMDEPSMGLAPVLVDNLFDIIKKINGEGVSILMVEQNAHMALLIADYGYVLQNGRIALHGSSRELLGNELMRHAYLATG
jgi:branched-chain amino acid transport system ATP-binding protein